MFCGRIVKRDSILEDGLETIVLDTTMALKKCNQERENMDKKKQEQVNRQKNLNEYNSVTQKKTPENQNQSHNVRKEGTGPINQKR